MAYQVLARKWRPSTFEEMVGQAHVLRALVNALDQQRLHHAYLFTGTRGVGKTTIARLLAKSLNCEGGVSSKPCGVCSACTEIAEGRFVDLIEVDAASRTKVEDTRELLENVQYAPTRGRYKVYLIDEVHMLSTSSFNALLKTLEEPPPHVKFLLATTDPQKLPVTVLSRCLQFNLKNMSREHIVAHLNHVLTEEQVGFDEPSLWAIAEGAQGSMRDALSLTDQAIAFGQGQLREQEVAAMLGTVDLKRVLKLVQALFAKNIDELMALIAQLDDHAPDYQALMTELMSTLHRIAIAQAAPNAIDNNKGDKAAIVQLAGAAHAEDVHLYYQIAAKAKPEMSLAPSERAGFEMALLRMLAFSQTPPVQIDQLPELTSSAAEISAPVAQVPETEPQVEPQAEKKIEEIVEPELKQELKQELKTEPRQEPPAESAVAASQPEPIQQKAPEAPPVTQVKDDSAPPWEMTPVDDEPAIAANEPAPVVAPEPVVTPEPEPVAEPQAVAAPVVEPVAEIAEPQIAQQTGSVDESLSLIAERDGMARWPETDLAQNPTFWWQVTLHRLGLSGMTKTLFAHSQWHDFDGETLKLVISPNYRKIMNENHIARLLAAVPQWLSGCQNLKYEFGAVEQTPQRWLEKLMQKANNQAFQYLQADPFIQTLMSEYQAELDQQSAVPNHNPIPSGA